MVREDVRPILHVRVCHETRRELAELGESMGGNMSQAARYLIKRGLETVERENQELHTRPGNRDHDLD